MSRSLAHRNGSHRRDVIPTRDDDVGFPPVMSVGACNCLSYVRGFDRCYRAVQSKDARFDGWFVTAVLTTKIYCRPSCPVRPPYARNMRFYPTAAAAQRLASAPASVAGRTPRRDRLSGMCVVT